MKSSTMNATNFLEANCQWDKTYTMIPSQLECMITYCDNPSLEPNTNGLNYNFIWDQQLVPINSKLVYPCKDQYRHEGDVAMKNDATNEMEVVCGVDGEFIYPTWLPCYDMLSCDKPPDPPSNGSRSWIYPALIFQEFYDTNIRYFCEDGSQFDVNGDQIGDSIFIEIRCQWNKQWLPYPTLPSCIITHCVKPFPIPPKTNLIELTSDWTPINDYKHYECKNRINSVHTMFWETDRSKSTFKLFCKPDGMFIWENWPTCLEDINCPTPPLVPSASDYTSESDDGSVTINSLEYPTYPNEIRTTNLILNYKSSINIPRNYMANLT